MPGMKVKLYFSLKATEFLWQTWRQNWFLFISFILIICPFSNNNKGWSFAADCQKLKSHDAEHNFGFLCCTNTIVDTETNTNVSSNRNTKSQGCLMIKDLFNFELIIVVQPMQDFWMTLFRCLRQLVCPQSVQCNTQKEGRILHKYKCLYQLNYKWEKNTNIEKY